MEKESIEDPVLINKVEVLNILNRELGEVENKIIDNPVKAGISFGSCLAMIISYTTWKSIPWAIIHGLLSWIYVFYYWLNYSH